MSFPASVALLILLFFALILSQSLLGDKKTKSIVQIIDVPVGGNYYAEEGEALLTCEKAGFALRYINVFFMPSFGKWKALA